MEPQRKAALALAMGLMIREISEDYSSTRWMHEVEFEIWQAIKEGNWDLYSSRNRYLMRALAELAGIAGGWMMWVGTGVEGGPKFVSLSEWLGHFGQWFRKQKERVKS